MTKPRTFHIDIRIDPLYLRPPLFTQVKVLYVRNLMLNTTEETLERLFNGAVNKNDAVERVKKIRDYSFVHFREREDALKAMKEVDGEYSISRMCSSTV